MRTSRIFWSLLLLFLSLTAAARAQGDRDSLAAATTDPLTVQTAGGNSLAAVEQVWDAANTAYINSDYHRAIDAYRQLILRGYASDKLYYNLANAYFKVGRYGKAILYYNRALRLAPGDADIRYNLDVANTFTKDKIAVVPEFFLKGWVRSVRMSLGCTAWSVVSLAALALLFALVLLYLLAGVEPAFARIAGLYAGAVFGLPAGTAHFAAQGGFLRYAGDAARLRRLHFVRRDRAARAARQYGGRRDEFVGLGQEFARQGVDRSVRVARGDEGPHGERAGRLARDRHRRRQEGVGRGPHDRNDLTKTHRGGDRFRSPPRIFILECLNY